MGLNNEELKIPLCGVHCENCVAYKDIAKAALSPVANPITQSVRTERYALSGHALRKRRSYTVEFAWNSHPRYS